MININYDFMKLKGMCTYGYSEYLYLIPRYAYHINKDMSNFVIRCGKFILLDTRWSCNIYGECILNVITEDGIIIFNYTLLDNMLKCKLLEIKRIDIIYKKCKHKLLELIFNERKYIDINIKYLISEYL